MNETPKALLCTGCQLLQVLHLSLSLSHLSLSYGSTIHHSHLLSLNLTHTSCTRWMTIRCTRPRFGTSLPLLLSAFFSHTRTPAQYLSRCLQSADVHGRADPSDRVHHRPHIHPQDARPPLHSGIRYSSHSNFPLRSHFIRFSRDFVRSIARGT